MISYDGKFEDLHIIIAKDDAFVGASFVDCCVDDVTNAPFDKIVFTSCHFENVKFRSNWEPLKNEDCFTDCLDERNNHSDKTKLGKDMSNDELGKLSKEVADGLSDDPYLEFYSDDEICLDGKFTLEDLKMVISKLSKAINSDHP